MPADFSVSKDTFIEEIRQAVYTGCGFNPLIGSGISAASGIIMGLEFSDYLAYVLKSTLDQSKAWDIRRNGWPPYPSSDEYAKTRRWTMETFVDVCDKNGYKVDRSDGRVVGIRPVLEGGETDHSLSKALNCPEAPSNIRSPEFRPFDASLHHVAASLRRSNLAKDRYEPLWPRIELSKTSARWILEIGLRSLADWRATLRFLSRVRKETNGRTILSRPDGSVVDRFNTFITSDKKPSLGHKMISALSRPLRMRTILTTNFDTLTEDAFFAAGHNLTKFFVSNKGSLPDPFIVRGQPSIIKLHGELLETRSDFSLDDDPKPSEKRRFFSYFVDTVHGTEIFKSTLSHLFVIGFSASDMRIIRLIYFLLDNTQHYAPNNRPKVFWICVTDSDKQVVSRLFNDYDGRLVTYQTARPDLLLLELYQRLTRALPGAGQTYEYNHNVPPSRTAEAPFQQDLHHSLESVRIRSSAVFDRLELGDDESRRAARDALARIAGHALFHHFVDANYEACHIHEIDRAFTIRRLHDIVHNNSNTSAQSFWNILEKKIKSKNRILFFNTPCGALESLSILHAKLNQKPGRQCLWFELADYINADSLLRDILRSIALRSGRFQRQHVMLHPLTQAISETSDNAADQWYSTEQLSTFLKQLCHIQLLSPQDWPILLYARDPAGSCVSWESEPWQEKTWNSLPILIGAFAMAGFPIVIAHSCNGRIDGENEKTREILGVAKVLAKEQPQLSDSEKNDFADYINLDEKSSSFTVPDLFSAPPLRSERLSLFSSMFEAVIIKCIANLEYRRFIYAACLFRQSRRPSALFYEAVQQCPTRFNLWGIDNDELRSDNANKWAKELERERVFFGKAGGTAWMHRDIRMALRKGLDQIPFLDGGISRAHCQEVARVHFWIGDWYEKAFYSTGFTKPVLESLHHRYQAAKLAKFALPRGFPKSAND